MKNFYRDGGLVVAIISLIVIILGLSGFILSYSPDVFWILAPFIVLISGFVIGKLIIVTRKTFQYYSLITTQINQSNKLSLYSFPLGVVIIDKNKKMVWFNTLFAQMFQDEASYGSSIEPITSDEIKSLLSPDGVEIIFKERYYQVYANIPAEDGASDIFMLFFKDITDFKLLQLEKKMSHPVVMIIMIDSYEEMFSSNIESETAHVTVQIDRLLENYIGQTTGILRKNGRDKFWAVVEERHIIKMLEDKVKLLDMAREIQVNDRFSVTLSLGIGRYGKTIRESEAIAKQALDMALGRGGDQAAVKTATGFEFFGGVSKGIERQTNVKGRIIANSLMQVVEKSDCVYIMGHKKSDLDSVGSAVGLSSAIRNLGKPAYAVVNTLDSLSGQLIDKVRALDDPKNPTFMSPSDACEDITENSLLVIVDTHSPTMIESPELFSKVKKVVIIDHHRKMVNHIDNVLIFHHDPYASSAAEMVTELLGYFGEAGKLSVVQAEALLSGIMLDTKNFTLKTGVRTFEAAAFLRKLGADTIDVKALFVNSFKSYRQKAQMIANADVYKRCAIAHSDVNARTDLEMKLITPQVADDLLGISDVDASFAYYYSPDEGVCISARSLGAINVQLIMEYLGGGGHQTMAGTQIKNISIDQARDKIVEAIDNYYESRK